MNFSYSQSNFSEVIDVDSANINVLDMSLIDNELTINTIYPDIINGVSNTQVIKYNLSSDIISLFNFKYIAVTANSPMTINSDFFFYGKNRSLEKPNHLVRSDSYLVINDSIPIPTKGDFSFPTRPYTLDEYMYLPTYIKDREQEYFSSNYSGEFSTNSG